MADESESDSGRSKADEGDDRPPREEPSGPRDEHPDGESDRPDADGQDGEEADPEDGEEADADGDRPDAGGRDGQAVEEADADGPEEEPLRPEDAPISSETEPPDDREDRPEHPLDQPADEYEPVGGPVDDGGPPDDEEMPLTEHIEEMVLRLAAVLAVAGFVTAIAFPFAQEPITFIWYSLLPRTVEVGGETISTQPRVYGPLELKLMELKLASLAGLIAALPMGVYQTYRFMRPGLYPHERRYYLAAVPTSLVLAFVGIAFAFFVVLPAIFTYFLYYSENAAEIAFALQQTFNLIIILKAFMAMVFQIPLMIMLAIMMGVTTRRWLQDRRLYFWAGFLGIAFLFSPDPTGMAPILVALTMVVLFEGTLTLLRWTGN